MLYDEKEGEEGIYRGIISKSELQSFPEDLRLLFFDLVTVENETDDALGFLCNDIDSLWRIEGEWDRIQSKRSRAENKARDRAYLVHTESAGVYEPEDILEILKLQEGRCYYTGDVLIDSPAKNYSIDHIVPVCSGGSCWPGNIVLALKDVNSEKRHLSKRRYFTLLEKRFGKEWINDRKVICKAIDVGRMLIDKQRKAAITEFLRALLTVFAKTIQTQLSPTGSKRTLPIYRWMTLTWCSPLAFCGKSSASVPTTTSPAS